jgi:trehalose-phosphatase
MDYDGTLSPIATCPELAYLPWNTKRILLNLSQRKEVLLGIISGRSISDVRSRVGLKQILYAGNHGLEISGPNIEFTHPKAKLAREEMLSIRDRLSHSLSGIPGLILEDKVLSLSLHFRQVEKDELEKMNKIFFDIILPLRDRIKLSTGSEVYNIMPPVDWDKGKAIQLIMGKCGENCLPLYLGDDLTDEDAFKVVKEAGGIGILVGERTDSASEYYLRSPKEVETFLAKLQAK